MTATQCHRQGGVVRGLAATFGGLSHRLRSLTPRDHLFNPFFQDRVTKRQCEKVAFPQGHSDMLEDPELGFWTCFHDPWGFLQKAEPHCSREFYMVQRSRQGRGKTSNQLRPLHQGARGGDRGSQRQPVVLRQGTMTLENHSITLILLL